MERIITKLTKDDFNARHDLSCGYMVEITPDTEADISDELIKQILKNQEIVERLKKRIEELQGELHFHGMQGASDNIVAEQDRIINNLEKQIESLQKILEGNNES
jgi:polyhydroxyalkanoate synthesis regulator phasin